MANSKLYAFDGELKPGATITEAELAAAFRTGYVLIRVEQDGYLDQGPPQWLHGSAHAYSALSARNAVALLTERCIEFNIVWIDLDQAPMGGGMYVATDGGGPIEYAARNV